MSQPKLYRLRVDEGNVARAGLGVIGSYIPISKEGPAVLLLVGDPHNDPGRPIKDMAPAAMAHIRADIGPHLDSAANQRPLWAVVDEFGRFNEAVPAWPAAPDYLPSLVFRRFPHGIDVDAFFAEGGPSAEAALDLLSYAIDAPYASDETPAAEDFLCAVEAHGNLPAPGIVFRKVNLAAAQGDAKKIAEAVQADPVLSASLINAANAARYAAAGKTASVAQAVVRLGSSFVSRVVFIAEMMARYQKGACATFDYRGYWLNAVAIGAAMRGLMEEFEIPAARADDVFFTGLVSSFGWLAVAETFPALMAKYLKRIGNADPITKARIQQEIFPSPIRQVTERYLSRFNFPAHIAQAVSGKSGDGIEWYDCRASATRIAQALSPFACIAVPDSVPIPPACLAEWERWRTALAIPRLSLTR